MAFEYGGRICKFVAAWIWVVWCKIRSRYLHGKARIAKSAVTYGVEKSHIESIGADGSLPDDTLSKDATSAAFYENTFERTPTSLKTTPLSGKYQASTTGREADESPEIDVVPEAGAASNVGREGQSVENFSSPRRRATDPDTACVDLRKCLESIYTELPSKDSRFFFPVDGLRRKFIQENILTELKRTTRCDIEDDLETLSQKIYDKAPRLFAILVWVGLSRYICAIMSENIDDSDLPLCRCDDHLTGWPRLGSKKYPLKPIKCIKDWKKEEIHNFNRDQHAVLSPVFRFGREIEHQELHKDCVLPFIEDYKRSDVHKASVGGYSFVSRVKLHPAHQLVDDQEDSEARYLFLALKCLYLPHEEYFKSEVAMLKKFRERKNPNLIRLLATFRYDSRYFLLFPYAKSDLRQYWETNPTPEFSSKSVRWVLTQCQRLVSGLFTVHSSTDQEIDPVTSILTGRQDDLASRLNDDVPRYGRHGDIKPENVLLFENGDIEGVNCEEGSVVLADFGVADLHRRATVSDIPATSCRGTPTYEPPEQRLGSKVSRAYDVWCLGCTYLEFLSWLVCGCNVLRKFPDARTMPTLPNFVEDTFYHIPEQAPGEVQRAEICEGVTRWMMEMRDLPRCSAFVDDFLDLISGEMLLVDPRQRISATDLKKKLSDMDHKATKDPSYLLEPKSNQRREQLTVINGIINGGPSAYRLKDGTLPMPSRTEGEPLPKRNGRMTASLRLRSVSPQVQPTIIPRI